MNNRLVTVSVNAGTQYFAELAETNTGSVLFKDLTY